MKTLFLATLDFIRRLSAAVPVLAVAALLSVAGSCSTTRVLQDGEYRLAKTEVHVSNDKKFNTGKIDPYIKQKPNSNSKNKSTKPKSSSRKRCGPKLAPCSNLCAKICPNKSTSCDSSLKRIKVSDSTIKPQNSTLKSQNSNNSKTPIKRTFDTIDSFLAIVSIFAIVSLDLCVMIWISVGYCTGCHCSIYLMERSLKM